MAKNSEKLVRQLSLISFLMAERRPVSAIEIRQEVEGYAAIVSDEAFNRRFYADRAELAELGIELEVEKSGEGCHDAETYTLSPGGFYLAIDPSDAELGELNAACVALGKDFAYAEPLGLLLERLSWVRRPARRKRRGLRRTIPARSQALAKLDTAIHRRKRVKLYYRGVRLTIEPHYLFFTDRFHLVGRSAGKEEWMVVVSLAEIEGKVDYATKAEHDFEPPDFGPEEFVLSAEWQIAESMAITPTGGPPEAVDGNDEGKAVPYRARIVSEGLARVLGLARLLLDVEAGGRLDVEDLCDRLQMTEHELRRDLDLLNVVNFGGGNYVLYAEVVGDVVEVEPEVHADAFARPMRLLPLEARALVGAIDLVHGELGGKALRSLRAKVVDALGGEPPGMRVLAPAAVDRGHAALIARSGDKGGATAPDLMAGLSTGNSIDGGRRRKPARSPLPLSRGRTTLRSTGKQATRV